MKDLLFALLAVVGGIGITVFIYWFLNLLVRELPQKIKKKVDDVNYKIVKVYGILDDLLNKYKKIIIINKNTAMFNN